MIEVKCLKVSVEQETRRIPVEQAIGHKYAEIDYNSPSNTEDSTVAVVGNNSSTNTTNGDVENGGLSLSLPSFSSQSDAFQEFNRQEMTNEQMNALVDSLMQSF